MLIYLDTEFSNFGSPNLISIGMVTDDGLHEFYAELPVVKTQCSDFVIENVLPQLGQYSDAQCTHGQLQERLLSWFSQFQFDHHLPVFIAHDSENDWQLLIQALDYKIPYWINHIEIAWEINEDRYKQFFIENKLNEHHALHDARANRYACNQQIFINKTK